jgi:subtilisin family serine protease
VIDTGIRFSHQEFRDYNSNFPRVTCGFDAFNVQHQYQDFQNGCLDVNGHGTFVASVLGGNLYGVAKEVDIVSVKVFDKDGLGSVGSVIAGLEFAEKEQIANRDHPMVGLMAFGTSARTPALETAVKSAKETGLILFASAGNEAQYVMQKFPAAWTDIITVGATTYNDFISEYSNFGSTVDIFAPGSQITGAWNQDNLDSVILSGTSGAAAMTAGAACLVLEAYAKMDPDEMKQSLQNMAVVDALEGIPDNTDTQNLLLNVGALLLA